MSPSVTVRIDADQEGMGLLCKPQVIRRYLSAQGRFLLPGDISEDVIVMLDVMRSIILRLMPMGIATMTIGSKQGVVCRSV